jgi:hypothetical protein
MMRSLDFQIGYPTLPQVVAQLQADWEASLVQTVSPSQASPRLSPVVYSKRKVSDSPRDRCDRRKPARKAVADDACSTDSSSPSSSPEPLTPVMGSTAAGWLQAFSSIPLDVSQSFKGKKKLSPAANHVWDNMIYGGAKGRRSDGGFPMSKLNRGPNSIRSAQGTTMVHTTRDWRLN